MRIAQAWSEFTVAAVGRVSGRTSDALRGVEWVSGSSAFRLTQLVGGSTIVTDWPIETPVDTTDLEELQEVGREPLIYCPSATVYLNAVSHLLDLYNVLSACLADSPGGFDTLPGVSSREGYKSFLIDGSPCHVSATIFILTKCPGPFVLSETGGVYSFSSGPSSSYGVHVGVMFGTIDNVTLADCDTESWRAWYRMLTGEAVVPVDWDAACLNTLADSLVAYSAGAGRVRDHRDRTLLALDGAQGPTLEPRGTTTDNALRRLAAAARGIGRCGLRVFGQDGTQVAMESNVLVKTSKGFQP